jgi:mRNA interferase MazF
LIGALMSEENAGMTNKPYLPDRGDIIWIQLDPRVGHEQSGNRPALVLSDQLLAARTGLIVMCPITSKPKGKPYEVQIESGKIKGAVLTIHVRSVDYAARQTSFINKAPGSVLDEAVEKTSLLIKVN